MLHNLLCPPPPPPPPLSTSHRKLRAILVNFTLFSADLALDSKTKLLKVRYVRILDTFVCSGALIWLFSPAWNTVKFTLKAGFVCPFVVDDPTDLGATIMVAQVLCLCIFNLSPTQKTSLFTDSALYQDDKKILLSIREQNFALYKDDEFFKT